MARIAFIIAAARPAFVGIAAAVAGLAAGGVAAPAAATPTEAALGLGEPEAVPVGIRRTGRPAGVVAGSIPKGHRLAALTQVRLGRGEVFAADVAPRRGAAPFLASAPTAPDVDAMEPPGPRDAVAPNPASAMGAASFAPGAGLVGATARTGRALTRGSASARLAASDPLARLPAPPPSPGSGAGPSRQSPGALFADRGDAGRAPLAPAAGLLVAALAALAALAAGAGEIGGRRRPDGADAG